MKKIIYYIYYRTAHAWQFFDNRHYYIRASAIVCLALGCLFLSFLAFVFSLVGLRFNLIMLNAIVIVIFVISTIIASEKKYKELEKKYAGERYKKLKGSLVFIFVVTSIILYFTSLYLFKM